MISKKLIPLLVLGSVVFHSGCDSTSVPDSVLDNQPQITSITANPSEILFSEELDGIKDTTLTVTVLSEGENMDTESSILLVVTDLISEQVIVTKPLTSDNSNLYRAQFDLETNTASSTSYLIKVTAYSLQEVGNYATTVLNVEGLQNYKPIIFATSSPDTIFRPTSGSVPATFTASVSDQNGDNTIDNVLLRVIDLSTGEVSGSPFTMADDGTSLGDASANDLIFTWELPVSQTTGEQNRDYNIEFFAIDNLGLSSDTVRTTFHIREAQ